MATPLNETAFLSFRETLKKEAGYGDWVAKAAPRLKGMGALGGTGSAVGGLVGAAAGSIHGYRQAREQGAGRGEALLHSLPSALSGGAMGAGAGAVLGGGAGALLPGTTKALNQAPGILGAGARFGQRQVHAFTGMLSPQELEKVHGGAHEARSALQQVAKVHAPESAPRLRAQRALDAAEAVQNQGLTSIPGYAASIRNQGLGRTLKTDMTNQWRNSHPLMTAAVVGMPLVGAAHEAVTPTQPGGPGKGERILSGLGGAAGGMLGGTIPIAGQVALGLAGETAGRLVGRGIDKAHSALAEEKPEPIERHAGAAFLEQRPDIA